MLITNAQVLEALGASLSPGDDVMIHASLGKLGQLQDGVDALVAAIRSAVGAHGTVIMMTDTRSFASTGRFSIDQPSETGLLTETFRVTPGVVRSCVPMVSFCAIGARAAQYTQAYNSHLDDTATITRLLENGGKMMLMGIGYEKCTLFHLAEERHRLPTNFYKTFEGFLVGPKETHRPISQTYFVRRDLSIKKDPSVAGRMLESEGGVRIVPLGRGHLRTFLARDFDDCCMQALDADPEAFLVK